MMEVFLKKYQKNEKTIFYFFVYTLVFLFLFFCTFSQFIINGKGFVWYSDGINIHIPTVYKFRIYCISIIKEFISTGRFNFNKFDFTIGLGMNPLEFFVSGYTEPINILYIFVKSEDLELAYNFLVILRFYLVGISFSICAKYFKIDYFSTLIGALIYVFCGFALFSGPRHPFFLAPMIYLPLQIILIEKIIKGEKLGLLIILNSLMLVSYYYFFYMNTIFIGIYFLFRYFDVYKKDNLINFIKCSFKVAGLYIITIGMSAIVFLPTILIFLNSSRTASIIADSNVFFHYNPIVYFKIFVYLITPALEAEYWFKFGYASIVYIAIIFFLFNNNKEFKFFKRILICITILLCIPFFGFIMGGFNNINNRWIYIYSFLVSFITSITLPSLYKLESKSNFKIVISIIFFLIPVFFIKDFRNIYTFYACISLLFAYVIIILINMYNNSFSYNFKNVLVLSTVCLSIIFNGYFLFSKDSYKYVDQFIDYNKSIEIISDDISKSIVIKNNKEFYRLENSSNRSSNSAIVSQYNSTSMFNNIFNKNIINFNNYIENNGNGNILFINGFDRRADLLALNNVKYYISNNKKIYPYSFELLETVSKEKVDYYVYENKYFLPLGYTYDSYMLESDFLKLENPLEKQESLLKMVMLKEDNNDIIKGDFKTSVKKLDYNISKKTDLDIKENQFNAKKDNASLVLDFNGLLNSELFIRLNREEYSNNDFNLKIKGENFTASASLKNTNNIYRNENPNRTINMGYTKKAQTSLTIIFPKKGTYTIDEIEIYAQPMDNFAKDIQHLKENTLQNIEITSNTIKGSINLEKSKVMVLSVPYTSSWKCYVNGVETEIMEVNQMHMGINLNPGENEILFKYNNLSGIKEGSIISLISLVIFIVYFFLERKRFLSLKSA